MRINYQIFGVKGLVIRELSRNHDGIENVHVVLFVNHLRIFLRTYPISEKEKENRRLVFTSFIKQETRNLFGRFPFRHCRGSYVLYFQKTS